MSENTAVTPKRKRSYDAMYTSNYRRSNPDKAFQWRVNAAVNLLTKLGCKVIFPMEYDASNDSYSDDEYCM